MATIEFDDVALNRVVMGQLTSFTHGFTRGVASTAVGISPTRSGNMKRKIAADPVHTVGEWRLESGVSVDADYAVYVHEGARPHVIRPRNASVLSFIWHGRRVFFRKVNHPGNAAQPFLRNSAHRVTSADPRIAIV